MILFFFQFLLLPSVTASADQSGGPVPPDFNQALKIVHYPEKSACQQSQPLFNDNRRILLATQLRGPFPQCITETRARSLFEEVKNTYLSILTASDRTLSLKYTYTSEHLNGRALNDGTIEINGCENGGNLNDDAFTLLLCHEIGHMLGGLPRKEEAISDWWVPASSEGEADYYAASRCMRRILQSRSHLVLDGDSIAQEVFPKCQESFSDLREQRICAKIASAGYWYARFDFVAGFGSSPSFRTPDPTVVANNLATHPNSQCRLDTYLAGALCNEPLDGNPLLENGLAIGRCPGSQGIGGRPRCWYSPPDMSAHHSYLLQVRHPRPAAGEGPSPNSFELRIQPVFGQDSGAVTYKDQASGRECQGEYVRIYDTETSRIRLRAEVACPERKRLEFAFTVYNVEASEARVEMTIDGERTDPIVRKVRVPDK